MRISHLKMILFANYTMTEFRTILQDIDLKTFLKGKFRGKYYGVLDPYASDLVHENFFSIEILEAEIIIEAENIRKWTEGGEFEEYLFVEQFSSKLPASTSFIINYRNGEKRSFSLDLKNPKLVNIRLFDPLYEKNKVFGTIEGDICGYVLRIGQIPVDVPIDPKPVLDDKISDAGVNLQEENTGEKVENGARRLGYNDIEHISFWNTVGELFQYVLLFLFALPLIFWGWPILLFIVVILLLQLLGSIIQPVIRYAGRAFISFLWIFFLFFGFYAVLAYFSKDPIMAFTPKKSENIPIETTDYKPIEEANTRDSIIRHFRVWKDYAGTEFKGYLTLKLSDWKLSEINHQNIPNNVESLYDFNLVLQQLISNDSNRLSGVYALFDSLRLNNKLTEKPFAEAIVSCIQDIPYTLILDRACDPWLYDDQFINDYLSSGGACHPNIKYGIFSPVEFVATLDGDCDTRALLLYTILSHYRYDVVMLSSNVYRHSIIAINLPYLGISKVVNSKRYVLWETTQSRIPPGIFPDKMTNMNYWFVNLISTNNTLQ